MAPSSSQTQNAALSKIQSAVLSTDSYFDLARMFSRTDSRISEIRGWSARMALRIMVLDPSWTRSE
jgi:hypothetical protein